MNYRGCPQIVHKDTFRLKYTSLPPALILFTCCYEGLYINIRIFYMLSSREFHEQVKTENAAVRFLQEKGVLRSDWQCPNSCGERFTRLKECDGGKKFKFKCSKCKCWKSLFAGSWLQQMKLPCLQVVDMLFAWSDSSARRSVAKEGKIKGKSATDWTRFIANCAFDPLKKMQQIKLAESGRLLKLTSL